MKAREYSLKHYYQPTNDSCGYAALAALLSYYGYDLKPEDLLKAIPEAKPEGAEAYGSITPQLATWCVGQGFKVNLTTFDFLIIDLSWARFKSSEQVIKRLKAVLDKRDVPGLGKGWSKVYVQEYINFLSASGKLTIKPHVTSKLLYDALKHGPVYINVATAPLYGNGRSTHPGLRRDVPDDVNGFIGTHSVVIYGNTEKGDFLLTDPWFGRTRVSSEALLCGVTGSEIECDAMCFQLKA